MEPSHLKGLRKLVLAIDGLFILLAMVLATGLHAALQPLLPFLRETPSFDQYAVLPYLVLPLFILIIGLLGMHRAFERVWTRAQLLADLAKLHVAVFLGLSGLVFLTQSVLNRSLLLGFLLCTFVLLYLERAAIGRWQRFQHENGQGRMRVLLVGDPSPSQAAFVSAANSHPLPPMLVGRVTSGNSSGQEPQLPPHLGNVADLAKLLHEQAIDRVLFFPPFETPEHAGPALVRCEAMGIPAGFSIALVHGAVTPAQVVSLFDLPFLSFDPSPKRPEALAIKHGLDVVAAATLLLLLVPLLTFIALAIRISMGRPIFFSQERAGLYGRRFRMFKFRTMDIDAEQRRSSLEALNEMGGPVFKATHDPRITRLGRLLRRLSLDELPQLFHVLLGTMSLVGPRPLPIAEQQNIRGWHRRRLSMKPGITGLWQVSGRNDVGFEEWMRLDLAYVDRWSLLEDFRILFKTIPTVLLGRGAR